MVIKFEFCTFSIASCTVEGFVAFCPSTYLLLISAILMKEAWGRRKKEVYLTEPLGKMHITETCLICLMIVLPMSYILVSLARHNRAFDFPLIFLIESILFTANWIAVLFISRQEHKRDGVISNLNLSFWIVNMIFLLIKVFVSDIIRFKQVDKVGDRKGFESESIIYYASLLVNLLLVILAALLRRKFKIWHYCHSNEAEGIKEKDVKYQLFRGDEIYKAKSINNSKSYEDHIVVEENNNRLTNKFLRVSNSSKDRSEVDNKYDDYGIDFIEVYDSSYLERMDIEVRVYWIRYGRNGNLYETKRSFREFRTLHDEIKEIFITEVIPEFPIQEKDGPPYKNSEVLFSSRQEYFNVFLKHLLQRRLINKNVKLFLKSSENLPFYGRIDKIHTVVSTSIFGTVTSENENPNSTESSKRVTDNSECILTIAVDIYDTRKETKDNGKVHVYYYIRVYVPDGGWEKVIRKRFSDFKALHNELLQISNVQEFNPPALPVENILSPAKIKNKFESGLISHRRAALQNYLLNILNDPRIYSSQSVIDFLGFDLNTLVLEIKEMQTV